MDMFGDLRIMLMSKEKTKKRIKQNAEVFTPLSLVNEMLDKLPPRISWRPGKTFCDPACGNGNFLVEILKRKLKRKHDPKEALKTIFGVDIMKDNIEECRMRLLRIIQKKEEVTEEHLHIVFKNIVWVDQEIYPDGSLDYHFKFIYDGTDEEKIQKWMDRISGIDDTDNPLPVIAAPVDPSIQEPKINKLFPD